ncbi:MAG: CPBP family intramembrane glutamic endopeptidase [Candidatus Sulfotelmatobacter sp.]
MSPPGRARDLAELILGYGMIVGIIWTPEHLQRFLSPIALLFTLSAVLARRQSRDELGMGWHGLISSLWILPAAVVLAAVSIFIAREIGTLHPLYKADFAHVSAYVLWTIYQQFLLQDYFMDRLLRLVSNEAAAISLAGTLFAAAHLPNLVLTAATLVWGILSCALFRRYRNLWALGLAQGLLGLCFAICVPDALHHHLRVGLGYLRYHGTPPAR